ncbi:MAG: type II toxin-antitoxin system VapC family toxin [Moorellales bacterium]
MRSTSRESPRPPATSPAPVFVLDAYAVLCYLQDEPGADEVERLLEQARAGRIRLLLPWVNLGEVYYRTCRTLGERKAQEVLAVVKEWPVTLLAADETLTVAAAGVKAGHALSYADAYAVAACLVHKAALVTGDPELETVEATLRLSIRWLG